MAPSRCEIALCICTYDRYDVLPKAVESVMRQSLGANRYEILVIDNSPEPARAFAFAAQFKSIANLRYVVEERPGLSNARNIAAKIASAPIVAFIDDDAIAAEDWAEQILQSFEAAGASTMIVGGRVDPIWAAPRPTWLHDTMLGSLSIVDWGGDIRIAEAKEWVAGTNMAFRATAILAHGGFSKNLGRIGSGAALLSNDEVELIARIRAAGGQLVYAPKARVRHLVDAQRLRPAWFRKRAAWQALSDFMMEPDRMAEEAKSHWPELVKYFNAVPPLERTVRGLAFETDDPELFRWQISAIYMLSILLLAGFEGVELG